MTFTRRSKYGAVRTEGYASKMEARRGGELELLERAGKITDLRKQVPYVLLPAAPELGFKQPLRYLADFTYWDGDRINGKFIVEDCKGFPTPAYLIKKRLLRQLHGIEITEIRGK
jgi:Protein of unknown function (DUF1064)